MTVAAALSEAQELVLEGEQVRDDVAVADLGLGQRQDQQRDRDGEDAVAERLDTVERGWGRAVGVLLGHFRPLGCQPGMSYVGVILARPMLWKKRLKPRNAGVASAPTPRSSTSIACTTNM